MKAKIQLPYATEKQTLGVQYPAVGSGPMGRGRLGDSGALNWVRCESCKTVKWGE